MRQRIPDLHVAYEIGSIESKKMTESKQEGQDHASSTKPIYYLSAHVTLTQKDKITTLKGYMAPLASDKLIEQENFKN